MKNLASLISSVVSSAFRKDAQTHNAGHSVSSSSSSSHAHSHSSYLHSSSPSSSSPSSSSTSSNTTLTSNSSTSSWTAISRHDLYGEANKTSTILQEIPLGHAHSPASHCDYCGHHPSNTPFQARSAATLSSRIRTLLCVPQVKRTEVPPPTIVLHPSPPDSSSSADLIGHVLPAIESLNALVEDVEIARFLSTKDEMPNGLSNIPAPSTTVDDTRYEVWNAPATTRTGRWVDYGGHEFQRTQIGLLSAEYVGPRHGMWVMTNTICHKMPRMPRSGIIDSIYPKQLDPLRECQHDGYQDSAHDRWARDLRKADGKSILHIPRFAGRQSTRRPPGGRATNVPPLGHYIARTRYTSTISASISALRQDRGRSISITIALPPSLNVLNWHNKTRPHNTTVLPKIRAAVASHRLQYSDLIASCYHGTGVIIAKNRQGAKWHSVMKHSMASSLAAATSGRGGETVELQQVEPHIIPIVNGIALCRGTPRPRWRSKWK